MRRKTVDRSDDGPGRRDSPRPGAEALSDERLVALLRGGDLGAFEVLMRRYNQRIFRVVRGVLGDDADAEDAVQETYFRAYSRLDQLADGAAVGGWLTRIAANEAVERLRQRRENRRSAAVVSEDTVQDHAEQMLMAGMAQNVSTPEDAAAAGEVRRLLEKAIDALPDGFRAVFMLRAVEQLSTAETAACLGLRPVTVKTRYFRAKLQLRKTLERHLLAGASAAFPFAGARCDRTVAAVLRRIAAARGGPDADADGRGAAIFQPSEPANDRRNR